MTPANRNDPQLARRGPARRSGSVLPAILWASVPVWSVGFLSFAPFLANALIRRRPRDWAVFAGYLAATVAMIVTVAAFGSGNGAGSAVAGGFIVALAGCAAVNAAILFRPGRAPAGSPDPPAL